MFSEDDKTNYIQHKCLEMMIIIDEICEKHGLTYYLYGESLIGAIRHKGFIPWDHDAKGRL